MGGLNALARQATDDRSRCTEGEPAQRRTDNLTAAIDPIYSRVVSLYLNGQ